MRCYVTPKECTGLANNKDEKDGFIAYKIAATPLNWPTRHAGALDRDNASITMPFELLWQNQSNPCFDPVTPREVENDTPSQDGAMIARLSSIRIIEYVHRYAAEQAFAKDLSEEEYGERIRRIDRERQRSLHKCVSCD